MSKKNKSLNKKDLFISTSDMTVSVVGYINKDNKPSDYINGKGYINDDKIVWIFSQKGKPRNENAYPYFWFDEDKIVFSKPQENMLKAFNSDMIKDLSFKIIVDETKEGEELFDEAAITDMNAAAAFYVPTIYEKDDFLKKVVKTTIIEKGIDINRLKGKTDKKYFLPNMKAALDHDTKMSVLYFCYWMELLGCDFDIIIADSGSDTTDPLKFDIRYSSVNNKMYRNENGELVECEIATKSFDDDGDDEEE